MWGVGGYSVCISSQMTFLVSHVTCFVYILRGMVLCIFTQLGSRDLKPNWFEDNCPVTKHFLTRFAVR